MRPAATAGATARQSASGGASGNGGSSWIAARRKSSAAASRPGIRAARAEADAASMHASRAGRRHEVDFHAVAQRLMHGAPEQANRLPGKAFGSVARAKAAAPSGVVRRPGAAVALFSR
ncbi:MAG: hypothetical protein ACJ8IK_27630 [Burkholderiaceae bacterium]|jgi:hypothetical protein